MRIENKTDLHYLMTPILNCISRRLALALVLATFAMLPSQAFGSALTAVYGFKNKVNRGELSYEFDYKDNYKIPCLKSGDLDEKSVSSEGYLFRKESYGLDKDLVTAVAVPFFLTPLKVERFAKGDYKMTIPNPVISGKKIVCPNEEIIYSTPLVSGSTWEWTLVSGGTISQITGNTIKIRWNNQSGTTNHKLTVKETNSLGESNTVDYFISIKDITLRCIGSFNISLDNSCKLNLTTEMILAGAHVGSNDMRIVLLAGTTILEDGIGSIYLDGISKNGTIYDFVEKTYTYKIIELCTNNVCSGSIKFEDQSPPMVEAPRDTTLGCAQVGQSATPPAQNTGVPLVTDCSTTTYYFNDQVFESPCTQPFTILPTAVPSGRMLPTTNDIVKIIVRTFIVTDKWLNQSEAQQVIFIKKGKIEQIICPSDVEYNCKDVPTPLTPAITGYPLVDIDGNFTTTNDRVSLSQTSCQISFTYKDDTFHLCLGSYKVVRAWTIFDWCAVDNPLTPIDERRKECSQVIAVLDKTPPSVSAAFSQYFTDNNSFIKKDTTLIFEGYAIQGGINVESFSAPIFPISLLTRCAGLVHLTITADDNNCSRARVNFTVTDTRMRILDGYPRFDAVTRKTIAVFEGVFTDIGEYVFQIEAKDVCGYALSKQRFRVYVRDNLSPQVSCPINAQTTLLAGGMSRIYAAALDRGTYDNCGLDHFEIRRLEDCQNPADTLFKPYVDFSCCDITKTTTVILRAWDKAGNYSDGTTIMSVTDNFRPSCIAPLNKTVVCTDFNFENLTPYGEALLQDNCSLKDTIYTVEKNIALCNIGTVTRKWVISDRTNKKDSCSQTITVTGKSDFTVDFPDDIVANCFEMVPTLEQTKARMLSNPPTADGHIIRDGCGTIAVEVKDDTLQGVLGTCYLILRTIKVIDWCKYNPNTISDPNYYGMPVCGDVHSNVLWLSQNPESWQNLVRPICNPQISTRERRFRDADGLVAVSADPSNPVNQNAFSDGIICFTQRIRIFDTTPPQFTSGLKDTIVTNLSSDCTGIVRLTTTAQDPCTGARVGNDGLLFTWKIVDRTQVDTIVVQGIGNNINENLPYNQNLIIYWSVSDRCGNITLKQHTLKVACLVNQNATIIGNLKTESGKAVPFVTLTTRSNGAILNTVNSATNGDFSVGNLTLGQNYTVKASRNDNPLNGVSTFDIALISKHILGITPLTSPYKIIAADVNKDGEVSAADMLLMRKLILRTTKTFPNNESWRFVNKNYVFQNPEEPFYEDFSEVASFNNLPLSAQADFVALKVGDVNGTVQPATFTGGGAGGSSYSQSENLIFEVEDKDLKKGEAYKITFKTNNLKTVGFQFTLNYTEGVNLERIEKGNLPDFGENNFEKFKNAVATSWNGIMGMDTVEAFSIIVKAQQDVRLSDILTISSNITTTESFDISGNLAGVELRFFLRNPFEKKLEKPGNRSINTSSHQDNGSKEHFTLYQNVPNPFQSETKISFNVLTETQATLTIYDISGKLLKTFNKRCVKGYNEIYVQREELNATGVLFYRLETPTQAAVKKMILMP